MIFPDDVLDIIRAFSKPLMRFSGDFRQVLMKLGLRDWPEVRQKLCTPYAEKVIILLKAYADVCLECSVRIQQLNRPMYPRILSYDRTEHIHYIYLRDKLYRELQTLLGVTLEPSPELPFYRHG
jgi:hypothetical protein